jgi:hypothetical protein
MSRFLPIALYLVAFIVVGVFIVRFGWRTANKSKGKAWSKSLVKACSAALAFSPSVLVGGHGVALAPPWFAVFYYVLKGEEVLASIGVLCLIPTTVSLLFLWMLIHWLPRVGRRLSQP